MIATQKIVFTIFLLLPGRGIQESYDIELDGGIMDTFEQMVATQLDKILSSDGFSNAPQLRQFLTYVVNANIQNKTEKIDAYNIATQALGRSNDFAPDLDPIVRVQAANLRQRLNLYNASTGANDPIQITLPRGGYVPVIENRNTDLYNKSKIIDPANEYISIQKPSVLPTVIVEMFDCDKSLNCDNSSDKFNSDLILALNRFDGIHVIPEKVGDKWHQEDINGYNYRLYGNCRLEGKEVLVDVFLVSTADGICLYSRQFNLTEVENDPVARARLVSETSSSIAELSGAIFSNVIEKVWRREGEDDDILGLIVRSYQFTYSPSQNGFHEAKNLVKRALASHPNLVFALCRLSFIFLDGYCFLIDGKKKSKSYLSEAKRLYSKAAEISPCSSLVNLLNSELLFATGRIEEAIKAGEFAIELNPENHQIAAIHGIRRVIYGDMTRGLELMRNAISKGHYLPDRLLMCELYHCVLLGDYQAALAFGVQKNLPEFFMYHVYIAGLHDHLGNARESEKSFNRSLELRPNLGMDEIWEINIRTSTSEFAEATRKLIKNVGYA